MMKISLIHLPTFFEHLRQSLPKSADSARPLTEPPAVLAFFNRLRSCFTEQILKPKKSSPAPVINQSALKTWLDHLRPPLDQLQAGGGSCNPWQVAKLGRNEVRNTAVLSWLLDPSGDHGLGNLLLTALLNWINNTQSNIPAAFDGQVTVTPEARLDEAGRDRVDILFRSRSDSQPFCLMIEAKIDAMEGAEQVRRYREAARRMTEKASCIVFLTTSGRKPSSAGEDVQVPVIAVSWANLSHLLLRALQQEKTDASSQQSFAYMLAESYLRHIRSFR